MFASACQVYGNLVSAIIAVEKNPKKRKLHPEEEPYQWYPLEIHNFPHWTLPDDIKATIVSLGPHSHRVRIIHYDPDPSLSVARAYFREEADRDAILRVLQRHEFMPGYFLQVMAMPRRGEDDIMMVLLYII